MCRDICSRNDTSVRCGRLPSSSTLKAVSARMASTANTFAEGGMGAGESHCYAGVGCDGLRAPSTPGPIRP